MLKKDSNLLPSDLPITNHYLIPDGIVASGRTVATVIKAIRSACQASLNDTNFEPTFTVMCPLYYQNPDGQNNLLSQLVAEFPSIKLNIVVGYTEGKGTYVSFSKDRPPKLCDANQLGACLVIGDITTNSGGDVCDIKIGDFGDMYTQGLESGLVSELFINNKKINSQVTA